MICATAVLVIAAVGLDYVLWGGLLAAVWADLFQGSALIDDNDPFDPLLLDDAYLGEILNRIHQVDHVEMIRIGSRVPVTLPDRITPQLCRLLSRFQPLYLNTHFNHPRELADESAAACARLADAGLPLGNQTVLLSGVNDSCGVMIELCRGLLKMRVRPYYLHHLDQARGTSHFRVPVERGLEIIAGMRGQVSGLGIPQYVIDPPGGEGKVALLPENLLEIGDSIRVRTSSGVVVLPNQRRCEVF